MQLQMFVSEVNIKDQCSNGCVINKLNTRISSSVLHYNVVKKNKQQQHMYLYVKHVIYLFI